MVPNLPTGTHELERAAGHKYYFETDSVACYNSFQLAPGASREALAIWTPSGLVQPTVLPFGQKNSGTEAQGPYREASKHLKNVSNYVDDWLGYANSYEQLCGSWEQLLQVCETSNITLNTTKTRIGYEAADFFGFTASLAGSCLADKHLNPLRALVPPIDIPEVRRCHGLFVVSRKYVKNFAMLAKPLSDLLRGSKPVFEWGEKQQVAFDHLRDLLLGGGHLAAPDYELTHQKMEKAPFFINSPTCLLTTSTPTRPRPTAPTTWPSHAFILKHGTTRNEIARRSILRPTPSYGLWTKSAFTPCHRGFRCTRAATTCPSSGCPQARRAPSANF
jgi:hypothetical protein